MTTGDRAEWPPHPARLFSALVATWAETDGDLEERAALEFPRDLCGPCHRRRRPRRDRPPQGRAALRPRERRQRPRAGSRSTSWRSLKPSSPLRRDDAKRKKAQAALDKAHKKHVDDCAKAIAVGKDSKDARKTALHVLPQSRLLQPRTFPSIGLTRPEVSFVFAEDPGMRRDALDRLCRRLVRLGHPSSLVSARVEDTTATPAWHPSDEGDTVLRWVESGQLARLEEAWPRHEGVAPRVLPAVFVRYTFGEAEATEEVPGSVFARRPGGAGADGRRSSPSNHGRGRPGRRGARRPDGPCGPAPRGDPLGAPGGRHALHAPPPSRSRPSPTSATDMPTVGCSAWRWSCPGTLRTPSGARCTRPSGAGWARAAICAWARSAGSRSSPTREATRERRCSRRRGRNPAACGPAPRRWRSIGTPGTCWLGVLRSRRPTAPPKRASPSRASASGCRARSRSRCRSVRPGRERRRSTRGIRRSRGSRGGCAGCRCTPGWRSLSRSVVRCCSARAATSAWAS
jgi:hypothetical protein